jgi:hypothetical protein
MSVPEAEVLKFTSTELNQVANGTATWLFCPGIMHFSHKMYKRRGVNASR